MNTLIVYATKYGCTEKCAQALLAKLDGKVDLCNLKVTKEVDLSKYDKVIIGGSVYIGRIRTQVTEFCSKNISLLQEKKIGLFICCMRDGAEAETQLNTAFPKELLSSAIAKENFGGEFIVSKMNFLDRFITKKVAKTDKDTSNILEESIDKFAQLMNSN